MIRPESLRRSLAAVSALLLGAFVAIVPAAPVAQQAAASSAGGPSGTIVVWGDNTYGQTAVPVGLTSLRSIAVGNDHSVAIRTDGVPVAFGRDFSNNLSIPSDVTTAVAVATTFAGNVFLKPDGTVASYSIPAPVGLTGVKAICGGLGHALALEADGTLVTWGADSYGATEMPAGLTNIAAISCGTYHSVALKADGTVTGWGNNASGQVTVPPGLTGVVAVAAGDSHTLALKADGTVVAWGSNGSGEQTVPAGLTNVIQVAAGEAFSLALKSDGTVVCWGSSVGCTLPSGLGNVAAITATRKMAAAVIASSTTSLEAWGANGAGQASVPTVAGPKAFAAGWGHTLALRTNGQIVAFGSNSQGQTTVPGGLTGVVKGVAAGDSHSLALKANGSVAGWGFNYSGQATIPAGAQSGVKAISAGAYHSLALKADGTVVAWGNNGEGETTIPPGLTNVVAISAGVNFNVALKADGTVVAWGDDSNGQRDVPGGLPRATEIAAGGNHTLVRTGSGALAAWGSNTAGQLAVPTVGGWIGVAAGFNDSFAIRSTGALSAWGDNSQHQMDVPAGTAGVTAISAGWYHVLAIVPHTVSLAVSGFPNPDVAGVSHSFTVRALDVWGNTDRAYRGTIHFTSSDPQATVPADYTFTAADSGVHYFSSAMRLKTAGTQSFTATDLLAPTVSGSQSGIVVKPNALKGLALSGYPNPDVAGIAHSFTVRAVDAYNNTVPTYTGTVHLTSSDSKAVLPADFTYTATDKGTHYFASAVTLKTAGTQWLRATDTVTATLTGTQSGIVVQANAARVLVVSGFPAADVAGVAHGVTVRANDSYGNAATGYRGTVHFTSSDAAAVLPSDYSFTAADAGSHAFDSAVTLKTAGTQSITVTDTVTATISGSQAAITVQAAEAAAFIVSGFPNPDVAGVAHSFTVKAVDAFGNTASGYRGTIHFSSSDPNAVLPADYTFTSTDAGTHRFASAVTLKTAGTQWIGATDTVNSSIKGSQTGIVVQANVAKTFSVTGYPAPGTAGTPATVTVTALDAYGNVATGYRGTVHFTSSDAAAVLPANYTFTAGDAGVHAFSVTLNTAAGGQWIRATDTVTATLTGAQTGISVTGTRTQ